MDHLFQNTLKKGGPTVTKKIPIPKLILPTLKKMDHLFPQQQKKMKLKMKLNFKKKIWIFFENMVFCEFIKYKFFVNS